MEWTHLPQDKIPAAEYCKYGDESSDSAKQGDFFDQNEGIFLTKTRGFLTKTRGFFDQNTGIFLTKLRGFFDQSTGNFDQNTGFLTKTSGFCEQLNSHELLKDNSAPGGWLNWQNTAFILPGKEILIYQLQDCQYLQQKYTGTTNAFVIPIFYPYFIFYCCDKNSLCHHANAA